MKLSLKTSLIAVLALFFGLLEYQAIAQDAPAAPPAPTRLTTLVIPAGPVKAGQPVRVYVRLWDASKEKHLPGEIVRLEYTAPDGTPYSAVTDGNGLVLFTLRFPPPAPPFGTFTYGITARYDGEAGYYQPSSAAFYVTVTP